ncbi:GDF9 factor, partial [Regulus satrapa]|nr:GDF9 factor [Regulus satrapa]
MASAWRLCVCLYCCVPWLCAGSQAGGWQRAELSAAAEDAGSELSALLQAPRAAGRAFLPPLLKVLQQRGWPGEAPRLRPDSRALRYMKRLYRMSASREGIPRAQRSRLYNTVRLFTPCWEGEQRRGGAGKGDVHSVDLLFNLDRVTALE